MTTRADRVHYLDWLRVLAVGGVFGFHALHPFDTGDWHVKNAVQSEGLTIGLGFFGSWGLAFFFLVSGASTWLALRWRTALGYVRERLLRLLVPLVVAYVLFTPLQFFIEEHHNGWYGDSYLQDLRRLFGNLWDGGPLLVDEAYHLWFLIFLLEFALLGLPLFSWLRGARGRRLVGWVASRCRRRGTVLLLALPLVPIHLLFWGAPGPDHGWGEFVFYFDFFVLGHFLLADQRLIDAVRRDLVPGLVLGIGGFVLAVATGVVDFMDGWWEDPGYSWKYAWFFALITLEVWGWLVVALGIGLRVRAFHRPMPRLVAAGAMPFFLVHQPVILAVAYFVVQWEVALMVKIVTVFMTSLVITTASAWALSAMPGVAPLFGVKSPSRNG